MLTGHYNDLGGSANTKEGIAVVQLAGNGTWQYTTTGSKWSAVGNVSPTQALLLPVGDALRFTPAANWNGQATLFFVAWDGSQGQVGGIANTLVSGGTTPFSIDAGTLAVTVNSAPVWVGTGPALTPFVPGAQPTAVTIGSVFGNNFLDNNPAATVGVAIVSTVGSGTWQFSTDSGATGPASLTFEGWDQTQEVAGQFFDITTPGGASAFSATSAVQSIMVSQTTNMAPSLANPAVTEQPAVAVKATSSAITVITLLSQASYTDPDQHGSSKLPQGIAIIGAAGGTWQYVLAGGKWRPLPSVSASSALLLPSSASVRLSAGSQTGTATLHFTAGMRRRARPANCSASSIPWAAPPPSAEPRQRRRSPSTRRCRRGPPRPGLPR